jgi:hypothetical protein
MIHAPPAVMVHSIAQAKSVAGNDWHPGFTCQTSWIGNTYGGINNRYVQMHIQDAYVNSSGKVFGITSYDEGHNEIAAYQNGALVAQNMGYHYQADKAITADSSYVYFAAHKGRGSKSIYYVTRLNASDLSNANFTGGVNGGNSVRITAGGEIRGLAVAGNKLYAVVPSDSRVYVLDTRNLSAAPTSFAFTHGRKITADNHGYLWIVQYSGSDTKASKILKYSASGIYQGSAHDITDCINPSEIATDNQGRLLVADSDPSRNNIRIYNISGKPSLVGTFGDTGGFYPPSGTNKGDVTPTRFDGITGAGTDSVGNYYVVTDGTASDVSADGLGTRIVSVKPDGELNWQLLGRTFVETSALDPADLTQAYNMRDHFILDYAKPPGQQATWVGYTYNRALAQADMRPIKHSGIAQIAHIKGKQFMLVSNQYGHQYEIDRFDGEQAIPAVIFNSRIGSNWPVHAPRQPSIWRDGVNLNGVGTAFDGMTQPAEFTTANVKISWNPWYMDANGGMWQGNAGTGTVYHQPCDGLDANDVPIYDPAKATQSATLSNFTDIKRAIYDAASDTLFVMGWTVAHPNPNKWWVDAGSEIARYNHWSTTPRLAYQVALPNSPELSYPDITGISVANDYIFLAHHAPNQLLIYNAAAGSFVATITPGPEVGGVGNSDTANSLNAYYKADTGEYVVLVEDDNSAKTVMYRITFGNPAAPVDRPYPGG